MTSHVQQCTVIGMGARVCGETVTIEVTDTDLTIHTDTGPYTVRRTTDQAVRNIKANRPRKTEPSQP